MKIIAFGESVIDKIYVIEELKPGLKFEILEKKISYGGPSLVASLFFSKMGWQVYFYTSLSNEKEGRILEKFLEKNKIKVLKLGFGLKKHLVIIEKKNKTRTILRESDSALKNKKINLKILKEADLIFLDRHYTEFFDLIRKNKKEKTEIIFDPSTEISERTLKVLKNINFPIIPWECLKCFSKNNLRKALLSAQKEIKDLLIVTCGSLGAIYLNKNKIKILPSYKTKEVDPTGAGDIFRAAFGFGLLKNWPLEKTIDFANFVASLHLKKLGNGNVLPSKKEIFSSPKIKNKISFEDLVVNYKKI